MLQNYSCILLQHIGVFGLSAVNFAKIKYIWNSYVPRDLCVTVLTMKITD